MIPKNKILAVANSIDEWDEGIGNTPKAAAVRKSANPDADFDFSQPGQSMPPAADEPAQVAATVPAQSPATPTSRFAMPFGVTPQVGQFPPVLVFSGSEQGARNYAGTFGEAPVKSDLPSNPFVRRAMKSKTVQAALKAAFVEQSEYRKVLKSVGPILTSEQQAVALLAKIADATNPSEIENLRAQYAALRGPAAEAARHAGNRICRVAYRKLDAALHALITATLDALDNINHEVEADEIELWAKYSLPHQMTGLLAHLNRTKQSILHHRAALELQSGAERINVLVPDDQAQIFETFTT